MSIEANKAVIRRYKEGILNSRTEAAGRLPVRRV